MKESLQTATNAYHAFEALSNSGIQQILKSPAHYKAWRNEKHKTSKARRLGSMLHYMTLTPDRIKDEVAFWSGKTFDPEKGKAKDFQEENKGKLCIPMAEVEDAGAIYNSMLQHEKVRRILDLKGEREKIIRLRVQGVPCKAMIDLISPKIIVDLKTTEDIPKFERNFFTYGYHIQARWYQMMAAMHDRTQKRESVNRTVVFVVVEKKPPYSVAIFSVTDAVMDFAEKEIMRAHRIYGQCLKEDLWPAYSLETRYIDLPYYLERRVDEEEVYDEDEE